MTKEREKKMATYRPIQKCPVAEPCACLWHQITRECENE